ncbi:alkene reductase, partial [Pseudomonas fragi]
KDSANAWLAEGKADAVAWGVPFIANPDLPQRLFNGWPLNPLRVEGMYGGGAEGYIDYPVYAE